MILKGLRKVLIIVLREILIPGLIKRLEKEHGKMQPYPFFLSPYPYLEPTLLSGKNWGNGHKELVLLLQI